MLRSCHDVVSLTTLLTEIRAPLLGDDRALVSQVELVVARQHVQLHVVDAQDPFGWLSDRLDNEIRAPSITYTAAEPSTRKWSR